VSSFDRARDVEQNNATDQPYSVDGEVVDGLRAALDVERSSTQQLTDSLQREQERVTHLTTELSQLSEQLTAERSLAAQLRLRNDVDLAMVSHVT